MAPSAATGSDLAEMEYAEIPQLAYSFNHFWHCPP